MWAIGVAEYPDTEYAVIRYESYERAAVNLAGLMAVCGPYDYEDMFKCIAFLTFMEEVDKEEMYDEPGKLITSLEVKGFLFILGKFENFKPDNGMTFKVVQDHRFCTPDHCFGDIAEMN